MRPVKGDDDWVQINAAFSKQSLHYDTDDSQNPLLQRMRLQVYDHVSKLIDKPRRILELNSGTGIDALHFIRLGHVVHATDLSEGMVGVIKEKIDSFNLQDRLTVQQLSYHQLHQLKGLKFDFVFSNFGGLNCTNDLSPITKDLRAILNPGSYVTWVIMPPVSLWEILSFLKGNPNAFRRFSKNGVVSHLEGQYFQVWYHSLQSIKKAFGPDFKLVSLEGLAALSPPPQATSFPIKHPVVFKMLKGADAVVRNYFPFNRCADHIIVSFQFVS